MEIKVEYQGNVIDAMEKIQERLKELGYSSISMKQYTGKLGITIDTKEEISAEQIEKILAGIKNLSCITEIL